MVERPVGLAACGPGSDLAARDWQKLPPLPQQPAVMWSITIDAHQRAWVSTDIGMFRWDKTAWKLIETGNHLSFDIDPHAEALLELHGRHTTPGGDLEEMARPPGSGWFMAVDGDWILGTAAREGYVFELR